MLLTSAFITYAGAFNAQLRGSLVEGTWRPHILAAGIPLEPEFSPLDLLITSVLRVLHGERKCWREVNVLPLPSPPSLSCKGSLLRSGRIQWT